VVEKNIPTIGITCLHTSRNGSVRILPSGDLIARTNVVLSLKTLICNTDQFRSPAVAFISMKCDHRNFIYVSLYINEQV